MHHEKITGKITISRRKLVKSYEYLINSSWHENFEICKVVKGNFDMIISNKKYFVQPGDLIVIKSGEIHFFDNKEEDNCLEIFTFDPLILYNFIKDFGALKTHIKSEELKKAGIDKKIDKCFSNIFSEFGKQDSSSQILVKANFLEMYGLLLRYFEDKNKIKGNLSKFIVIHNIIDYISDNYNEDITLACLSDKFNYSPQYISSAFVTCTGINFKEYLDNIRISKATQMLYETTMSISEIATECGFDNIRTFNNVYKRVAGVTPKNVRSN